MEAVQGYLRVRWSCLQVWLETVFKRFHSVQVYARHCGGVGQ